MGSVLSADAEQHCRQARTDAGMEAESRLGASPGDVDEAGLPCSPAARNGSRQAFPESLEFSGFRISASESEREVHVGQDGRGSGGPVAMRTILDQFSVLVPDAASAKEIQWRETV